MRRQAALLLYAMAGGMVGHVAAELAPHKPARPLSLPRAVASAGGIDRWNGATPESAALHRMLDGMVRATTTAEALVEVRAVLSLGHPIWAYAYMRALHARDERLYFATLLADPETLLPVVYTPTVGEACQKLGALPVRPRGCFVSLTERGRVKDVLREYALAAGVPRDADGRFEIEAIVVTDGGRILGLGDLGAWGMGIPLGKLDLYTVCAGFDPQRTLPVLLDVGISPADGNTARLAIDRDARYTGLRQPRALEQSAAGTAINSALHGREGLVEEFMRAATELFGPSVLLQFEDFNANDAFPLLAATRARYLAFNDDIQGTAAVAVAGLLGALRVRAPEARDLRALLRTQRFLFHGSGSANLGAAALLASEGGVPASSIFLTNSRGLLWRLADGATGGGSGDDAAAGNYRNDEQRALAAVLPAPPRFDASSLSALVRELRPHFLVGAVGRAPGCFDQEVVRAMVEANGSERPTIFALSNPLSQAEATAAQVYGWSNGTALFGSGTMFAPVELHGRTHAPGQVNNFLVFGGVGFAAVRCAATTMPESLFFVAAEAVANALTADELADGRVVPHPARIRAVSLDVATATVLECQRLGIARRPLGATAAEVRAVLEAAMWDPRTPPSGADGAAGAEAKEEL